MKTTLLLKKRQKSTALEPICGPHTTTHDTRISQINGNLSWIKLLAMLAMVWDHAAYGWCLHAAPHTPWYPILRMPGRISIPIFSFLIAWNYVNNTRHPLRYITRIGIFALCCEPLYYAYFGYPGNAFIPLFLGALIIHCIDTRSRNPVRNDNTAIAVGVVSVFAACAMHQPDIACQIMIMPIIYACLKYHKWEMLPAAIVLTLGLNSLWLTNVLMIPVSLGLIAICFTPKLHLPPARIPKWAGYGFYPLHLLLLFRYFGPA